MKRRPTTTAGAYAERLNHWAECDPSVASPAVLRKAARYLLRQNAEVRRLRARVAELEAEVVSMMEASR